ncbi:DUF2141 domain-containing protein [Tenacibaculum sp. TC6]|uniref:DUF2141 domain-containing protein n=1 Tax=Tenacibaculum sp. TC6 TaxID=3423223 RepID=UPI003D36F336
MKLLVNTFVLIAFLAVKMVSAQSQSITVEVVNATSDTGTVNFALYDKEGFLMKPLQSKSSKISQGKSLVVFENVLPGEYAVVCYHDKNENKKMDFQPNGMPLEDYGASNNVMNFGPPVYMDAKFTVVNKDVSLEIRF